MGRERSPSPPQPERVVEDWRLGVERALSRAGYRFTAPRRTILDWIARCDTAFTSEALAGALEARHESSSRATVYRLINWLHATGWLARVHTPMPGEMYGGAQHAYARALPGHYSAVCSGCGAVLVVQGGDIATLLIPALAGTGFEVRGHRLELYGLCERCGMREELRARGGR